ncbi:ABC transporter substrate-binding protein [Altererythrobacter sp. RZ02]|uniref:ABC transporter substrate-binding protein n=1 Tax=Pontixanthobacter rizhaonensis TaxID=2730337 RepID=A0A848QM87_9SPHN|nr:ABC transporter substrate-binding protein [Pontixanthobacter rizhaonensis]NMW31737.1 ABC transporter substrate-binding protein [Pontixanthobacter rizhaonensis]
MAKSANGLWLLLGSLSLFACGQAEPPEKARAQPTIVSLNPCTDAILAEVAGPEQLLAISHYSHSAASTSMDLAKARRYNVTGGTVEEVVALQPDIVVAGAFMPPATRAALDDLGFEVVTFGVVSSISDARTQIRDLAQLAGAVDSGDRLVADVDAALLNAKPAGDAISAVLWQPSGIVPGEDALVSELLRHAGFTSHSAAMGLQQADYLSLERMLTNPPEVLLLAGQERSQQHPVLGQLPDTHRATLDSSLLYCGGPTIIRMMDRLSHIRGEIG